MSNRTIRVKSIFTDLELSLHIGISRLAVADIFIPETNYYLLSIVDGKLTRHSYVQDKAISSHQLDESRRLRTPE